MFRVSSRRLGVERGEVELPETDGGAHDPMAERGDAPAARARDLRNQPVDVEAVQEAADLGTLLRGVRTQVAGELGAQVAVGEAVHGVLPAMRATKSWESGRATGLKALTGRPAAGCLRVVMVSSPRSPGVGSSTWAKALRDRALLCCATSR